MANFMYRSAQDHVNHEVYRLVVLEGYNLNVPKVYTEGIQEPSEENMGTYRTGATLSKQPPAEYFTIGGLPAMPTKRMRESWAARRFTMQPVHRPVMSNKVRANLTIAHMVDMASLNLFFEFQEDYDVLEVFHTVDSYLNEIRPLVLSQAKGVALYAGKVLDFRAKLYRLVIRLLNKDKSWRDAYYNQVGITTTGHVKTILDFIAIIDPQSAVNQFDPETRLKTPPYRIMDGKLIETGRTADRPTSAAMTEEEIANSLVNGMSNIRYRKGNSR